jgi:hypothetical protein
MFYVGLFFSFVNDYGKMTINTLQIMHCMLYYYTFLKFCFWVKRKLKIMSNKTCACKPFRKLYENLEKKFGEATY